MTSNGFRSLGPSGDLKDNWAIPFYLSDLKLRIGVARVGGELFAFDDLHETANGPCPLTAGRLVATTIMSQCDGTTFDLTSGAVVSGPGSQDLKIYECRERDGQIEVRV